MTKEQEIAKVLEDAKQAVMQLEKIKLVMGVYLDFIENRQITSNEATGLRLRAFSEIEQILNEQEHTS